MQKSLPIEVTMQQRPETENNSPNNPDYIIIGAGLAGLSVANELTKLGFNVTIIEARNYIGGRIATDTIAGAIYEKGAAWRHKRNGNLLNEYFNASEDKI